MILCLVTDRRRLGAALGAGAGDWPEALTDQVRAAAEAGVDLVQVREPDLEAGSLAQLVRQLIVATANTPTKIIVNDRLDIALATGAAGVHLKERSFATAVVRRLVPPGFLVGRSIHSSLAAHDASDADYLVAGTVQPTWSKPSAECLGWAGLSELVKAAVGRPVLGIGGIDLTSIPFVAASGAAGMAAIGAFIPGAGQDLQEFVQKRVMDMRLGFDSAHPLS